MVKKRLDEGIKKRVLAGRLLLNGKKPAEVALAVGVARQTVYTWKALLDEGGIDALRSAPSRGRPPRLDETELKSLRRVLLQKPTEHGFGTELWTLKRVGVVIQRMYDVKFGQAYKSQIGERLSAMKTLCSVGNAARSRPLKKSPARRPSDCLCRRVRNQRTPDARSHLGAQGTDACHSISLQLESRLGYCWAYPHQLRIPTARWQHQEGTDRRISQGTESASEATSASDLGRFEATSQSIGSRLPRLPEWSYPDCVSSSLRSRIESGRISLGVAQTACLGQLLPKRPERVAPECPQQTQERAKASFDHCGLLDAGHALVMS